jgi:hypothetical protein
MGRRVYNREENYLDTLDSDYVRENPLLVAFS